MPDASLSSTNFSRVIVLIPSISETGLVRFRKLDGFGPAVTRIFAGRNNLNPNIVGSRTKLSLRTFEGRTITESDQLSMKAFQAFFCQKQINVLSESPIAILIQGDRTDDGIVNSEFVESADYLQ